MKSNSAEEVVAMIANEHHGWRLHGCLHAGTTARRVGAAEPEMKLTRRADAMPTFNGLTGSNATKDRLS